MKEIINGYSDDVVKYYNEFIDNIDELVSLCRTTPNVKRKKTSNKKSNAANQFTVKSSDKKLCNLILVEIPAWTEWSAKIVKKSAEIPIAFVKCVGCVIGETIEFITELIAKGIETALNWVMDKIGGFINDKIVIKCLKYLNIVKLFVKKTILLGEREVLKITKKMYESAKTGKFLTGMNAAILATLSFLQSTTDAGLLVINIIEKILGNIMLSVDGESMAFLFTPKTAAMGKMSESASAVNSKQSIFGGIMDAIYPYMDTAVNSIKSSNQLSKVAYISAAAAATIAANGEIPDRDNPKIEEITTDDVINIIEKIAYILFPESEPLPKFERLHPLNIGFMMWMLLSFQPAMKNCFGLPGYP